MPSLTPREIDVLRALAAGGTTASASRILYVSESTVRSHVKNILGKLGMHSRTEAVAWAVERRVVSGVEFR